MIRGGTRLHQPLVFLDTNIVHDARLCLEFARQHNLSSIGQSAGDLDKELRKAYKGRTLRNFVKGRKIIIFLRNRCDSGARIEYSPITRLELVCGLLRGQAVLNAAEEGIPHRMWSRIDEDEILHRLSPNAYETVQRVTGGLEDLFQGAGILISETDPQRMPEVWSLARSILGFVFLNVGDSIVYASALLAEADELVTDDGYLRKVAIAIENPGAADRDQQAYFRQARTRLLNLLSDTIGISASEARLPKSPKSW